MIDDFNHHNLDHDRPPATDNEPSSSRHEKAFQTPDEVAKADSKLEPTVQPKHTSQTPVPKTKLNVLSKLRHRWQGFNKKQKIIAAAILAIIILLIAGGITYAVTRHHKPAPPKKAPVVVVAPKPTTVPSTLSGLPVAPSVNQRPVTGVMIENSDFARPQSGLDQAGVVFEAVAEGGITRFLALFQDTQPSYVGPIRSARPYYVQWDLGFDAAYAHVGGSPDALSDIQSWGVKDLDEFYNGGSYGRINSRVAPHNVYTSIAQLNALEASKGYGASQFVGFIRKLDSPAKSPTTTSINLSPSGPDYAVQYAYNATANDYLRSEGGQPHMEINQSGQQVQISPKVVIGIIVPESQGALDASGAYYSDYTVIGSGAAYVFQDGGVTIGTWQKTSNTSQITFTTSSGQPIRLNAGQTWITALGSASNLTY